MVRFIVYAPSDCLLSARPIAYGQIVLLLTYDEPCSVPLCLSLSVQAHYYIAGI